MTRYDKFFRKATGQDPYPYQTEVAETGLPPVLCAPTGAGKTAAVALAWLWRRHEHPDPAVRASTTRRLVIALPMRVLVDQTETVIRRWVQAAGLDSEVDVHVMMGGQLASQHDWRRDAHRSSIVIGTADMLVSKLLMRAYGTSRGNFPLDFALLSNGSHVVLDEVQLMPEAATTLRQIAAFAGRWPTAEPFGVSLMSATVDTRVLDTVDNPWGPNDTPLSITDADRTGALRKRLTAPRLVTELAVKPGDYRALAKEVVERHRAGTRTLVVLNTVKAAVDVFTAVNKLNPAAARVLAHSRFRPLDRAKNTAELLRSVGKDGRIVIATQVIEAGVDLDSATLITEAAMWPSIVQRAGRCNRAGDLDDAKMFWVESNGPAPYVPDDVAAAVQQLRALEGSTATSESLLGCEVFTSDPECSVLRAPDFLGLFDTAPDLSGGDVDVAPYIRPGDDLDVQVAWEILVDGKPDRADLPPQRTRCPVPLRELRMWLKKGDGRAVWTLDSTSGSWTRLTDLMAGLRPGMVLIADANKGGYTHELGFSPSSTTRVEPVTEEPDGQDDPLAAEIEGVEAEPGATGQLGWVTVREHLKDTAEHARSLLAVLDSGLPTELGETVVTAALLHDLGKAAKPWADALLKHTGEGESLSEPPYAKSASRGRLNFGERKGFRHELVSALILDKHLTPPVSFLTRYLVAAHHGRIRLQARDATSTSLTMQFGLTDGEELPLYPIPRVLAGLGSPDALTVDLAELSLGGESSWTRNALELLDEHGPFVLAYLELLVRVADWRSSAAVPLAEDRR